MVQGIQMRATLKSAAIAGLCCGLALGLLQPLFFADGTPNVLLLGAASAVAAIGAYLFVLGPTGSEVVGPLGVAPGLFSRGVAFSSTLVVGMTLDVLVRWVMASI
jgi:membrane associated rhomboid family serine protease